MTIKNLRKNTYIILWQISVDASFINVTPFTLSYIETTPKNLKLIWSESHLIFTTTKTTLFTVTVL